jgi:Spy/CpxP family protein refolding chaperone
MQVNSIKNRLKMLESRQQQPSGESLQDRIAHYIAIMDSGDYDSEDGRALKATIDKYGAILEEIGDEDELN